MNRTNPPTGQEICQIGCIGQGGILSLLRKEEEQLKKRLPPFYLKEARDAALAGFFTFSIPESAKKVLNDAILIPVEGGGILRALWELGERMKTGFRIEIRKILVRQETVEICEVVHRDVYTLSSGACFLTVTDEGSHVCDLFRKNGIPAAVIGYCTERHARILENGEEERYLDKPRDKDGKSENACEKTTARDSFCANPEGTERTGNKPPC